jgi:plastocyanin
MRKLALVLSLLALAMFAIAACGGDDDDDGETPAAETTAEETTTEAGGGGAAGGAVAVEADPGGQLAFVQDSLEAPAGTVTFEFTNDASIGHDFVIEDADANEIARTEVITGDSTSVDADLEAGVEYTFYCSVDAHREAGMEGPLTVE